MSTTIKYLFLLTCLVVLGALTAGGASVRQVPAPNGTDDTASIVEMISASSAGDTIAFAAHGQYNISKTLTLAGSRSYQGNDCTLNWISTSVGSLVYLKNVSNITISGFTFNGSANGGNIFLDPGVSFLTFTHNTIQHIGYTGGNWTMTCGLLSVEGGNNVGLQDSTISWNSIHDLAGGGGIDLYSPTRTQVTDNTFANLYYDAIGGSFDGSDANIGTNLVFARNVGVQNCNRCGMEFGGWGGRGKYTTTNMLIDSNTFAIGYANGTEMSMSIVNAGNGTVIANNDLTLVHPAHFATCLEFSSDAHLPENGHVTHNIFHDAPWCLLLDDGNMGITIDENLCVHIAHSPFGEGRQHYDGGSPDLFQHNWAYGCTITQPDNKNMTGACPTVTIAASPTAAAAPAFTVTRTGGSTGDALTVYYTLRGTASNGTDYQTLSGSVTIPSGAETASIPVTVIHDSTANANKTVVTTLAFGGYYIGASKSATVEIGK